MTIDFNKWMSCTNITVRITHSMFFFIHLNLFDFDTTILRILFEIYIHLYKCNDQCSRKYTNLCEKKEEEKANNTYFSWYILRASFSQYTVHPLLFLFAPISFTLCVAYHFLNGTAFYCIHVKCVLLILFSTLLLPTKLTRPSCPLMWFWKYFYVISMCLAFIHIHILFVMCVCMSAFFFLAF